MAADVSTLALAADSRQVPPAVAKLYAPTVALQRVEKPFLGLRRRSCGRQVSKVGSWRRGDGWNVE
jgi:hypothetical protein